MTPSALIEATAREYLRRHGDNPENWADVEPTVRGVIEAMPGPSDEVVEAAWNCLNEMATAAGVAQPVPKTIVRHMLEAAASRGDK